MNVKEYAQHRGVSQMAVRKAIKYGRITVDEDGQIHPETADEEWARNTSLSIGGAFNGAPPADFNTSRALREEFNAKLAQLEYEERVGTLISADKVKQAWFNTLRVIRDRVLQIPDRVGANLAAETNANVIKVMLDAEFRRILDDAANEIANSGE